jgi:hypothetical protein
VQAEQKGRPEERPRAWFDGSRVETVISLVWAAAVPGALLFVLFAH